MGKKRETELEKRAKKSRELEEQGDYLGAVQAFDGLERGPESDSLMARRLNNYAVFASGSEREKREILENAVRLLIPHRGYFGGEFYFNFRMGYAYYNLDRADLAIGYFRRALEASPGERDTEEYIERCKNELDMPLFSRNFDDRADWVWEEFSREEESLRARGSPRERRDEIGRILAKLFPDRSFGVGGIPGDSPRLTLMAGEDKGNLFLYKRFIDRAPAKVKGRWTLCAGIRPGSGGQWNPYYRDVTAKDVEVLSQTDGERMQKLKFHCRKLDEFLPREREKVSEALDFLKVRVLGEVNRQRYITGTQVFKDKLPDEAGLRCTLDRLCDKLKEKGYDMSGDTDKFLDTRVMYSRQPREDPEDDLRMDIFAGISAYPALTEAYNRGDEALWNNLYASGMTAGFLAWPLGNFGGRNKGKRILEFRRRLEDYIAENAGKDSIVILGGATGIYTGYMDFLTRDLKKVLLVSREFFRGSGLNQAYFHTFRRSSSEVELLEEGDVALPGPLN